MISITPATKVADLLEQFPDLEAVLVAQAPAFQKLRNPVLRRTIARVASLEQAAAIAGLSPRDLVVTLRQAAGQPVDPVALASALPVVTDGGPCAGHAAVPVASLRPVAPATGPVHVLDVDALLSAGEVPLKAVFDAAATLTPGEQLRILVAFQPVPMIERLASHGYQCEFGRGDDGRAVLVVQRGDGIR